MAMRMPLLPAGLAGLVAFIALTACSDAGRPATPRSGEQVVRQHCLQCHERGLFGAPIFRDAPAWQAKLAEAGPAHLWQVVLNGEKAMPPRGNCHDCSDDELRAAVDYLLTEAGQPSLPSDITASPMAADANAAQSADDAPVPAAP